MPKKLEIFSLKIHEGVGIFKNYQNGTAIGFFKMV